MSDLPLVSVVMPVRNEGEYMERSLRSVLAQDYPADRMEILVADGMSTDGTRETIDRMSRTNPHLRRIENPGKIVSPGLNAAIAAAKGSIIVRVDGHCEIAPDYVSKCVAYLQTGAAEGVGGPIETIGENFISKAIAEAMSSNFGVGGSAFRVGSRIAKLVDTVAFPAYPRAVLDKAGKFDEELVRNQDDEYNYRLRKMGCRLLLAPDVRSKYFSRASMKKLWSQYFQYGYWKVRVLQKHPAQMSPRQFAPPAFALALCTSAAAAMMLPASPFYDIIPAVYLFLNLTASLMSARKNPAYFFVLPVIFFTIHFSYGLGFLKGLAAFCGRKKS